MNENRYSDRPFEMVRDWIIIRKFKGEIKYPKDPACMSKDVMNLMTESFNALADRIKAFADSVGTSIFNITKWITITMITLLNKYNPISQISNTPLEVEYVYEHKDIYPDFGFYNYQLLKINDNLRMSGGYNRLFQFNCFGLKHNEKINFKVVYVTQDSDEENLESITISRSFNWSI